MLALCFYICTYFSGCMFLYLDDTPIGLFPFVFTLPSVVKPIKIKIKLVRKTGSLSIYWHKMAKLLQKSRQFSPA